MSLHQNSEWLKGLRKQDRHVQKQVFIHYFAYVKAICLRYAKNDLDAEELLNDVFVKVFFKIDTYKDGSNFKAWLGQIAVNTCIDKYRKNLKNIPTESMEDVSLLENYFEDIELNQSIEILPVISDLPETYRIVFNLYVFDDYSHKEIAEKLNISVGTSKSCLFRAKEIIKNHMVKLPKKKLLTNEAI